MKSYHGTGAAGQAMLESFQECVSVLDESVHRRTANSSHSVLEVSRLARWQSLLKLHVFRGSPDCWDFFHPVQPLEIVGALKWEGTLFSLIHHWNTHRRHFVVMDIPRMNKKICMFSSTYMCTENNQVHWKHFN